MVHPFIESTHKTFPLTHLALERLSLTPEFDYPDPYNARQLNGRLRPPLPLYTSGEISAVGLIGKISLKIIDLYLAQSPPGLFSALDEKLLSAFGAKQSDTSIVLMLSHFPTSEFHYSPANVPSYQLSFKGPAAKRHVLYKSFMLIFLADSNQALLRKDGLFTDPELRNLKSYTAIRSLFIEFFAGQPAFESGGSSLFEFLLEPARKHPESLYDQLEYIRHHWGVILGEEYLAALLRSLDLISEERFRPALDQAPGEDPLGYSRASYHSGSELVRFSADQDWMPRVILLAKNIYVWLDQLSKNYQRSIYHLNHIPDEELARLSRWGITGLWLIGLWQRSSASQKIKQICGNPDAVPSAYSLFDYAISDSLGGEEAYQDLSRRAGHYNIRLAADMVPNHMGIYSRWIVDHPDWFLAVDKPPYPGYSFKGVDLSEDQRVSLYLEDHYYDKTDAAVVFKRVDHLTGSQKFIYHGNDGTSMPWNDTAQLDFLNPVVREAVIQNILHVARKFPIIRFDAAMTLAKKHIQRLWFPEPGSGGAIPTRSDFSLTKKMFDDLMPEEFWRQVVDRIASEVPDTLLLAEAFWMMEGYFVRSLGMHRVYNSAFMHMLRDEENQEYRDLIIQTLEYDPQILKRYVNFMNNPDEDTAVAQFGSDGKYFGICVLMSTLPGLPMFGHGQIEGFAEKYGMEYQRAYYTEEPNRDLIDRHQKEIFPLLHKRSVFADVENFFFFDWIEPGGKINQNVFVYTNRLDSERALIFYHNKWGNTRGAIHSSVVIQGNSTSLIDALGYSPTDGDFLLFRDQVSGQEYIRSLPELSVQGFTQDLGAYDYRVFMDFAVVSDQDGSYSRLATYLSGDGTPSLRATLIDLEFAPLAQKISLILSAWAETSTGEKAQLAEINSSLASHLNDLKLLISKAIDGEDYLSENYPESVIARFRRLDDFQQLVLPKGNHPNITALMVWALLFEVFSSGLIPEIDAIPRSLFKQEYFSSSFAPAHYVSLAGSLTTIAALNPHLTTAVYDPDSIIEIWFKPEHEEVFLGVNEYEGTTWFKKESFERLLDITLAYYYLAPIFPTDTNRNRAPDTSLMQIRKGILKCMEDSNYQLIHLQTALNNYKKEWNSLLNRSRS